MSGPASDVRSLFAPHERDGRFFCPWAPARRSLVDVARWQLARPPAARRRPRGPIPRVENDGAYLASPSARPELTWIGHSSFALQDGDFVVLMDPHFGPRALLPRRWSAPGLPLAAVPGTAVALLSHNHYDHLDAWTLARLPKSVRWLVPLGLERYLRSFGFSAVRALDWWGEAEVGDARFTFLPAQHWSSRFGQAVNTTLWGAWLIETSRARVLFGADSGWFHGYAELGRRYPGIDAALLPIGAYAPRWFMGPAHMTPEEALRAFEALGARWMVPAHWGAFDLADEPVDEPPRALERLLAGPGRETLAGRVRRLAIGERLLLRE